MSYYLNLALLNVEWAIGKASKRSLDEARRNQGISAILLPSISFHFISWLVSLSNYRGYAGLSSGFVEASRAVGWQNRSNR